MRRIFALLLCAMIFAGCAKKGAAELTLDQVPEAIRKAFTTAKNSLLKTSAEGVAKLVEGKHFAAASLQLQALSSNSDLTEDQRNVVAGALAAVNGALQEIAAAAQPAAQEEPATGAQPAIPEASKEEAAAAAAVLEHYSRTK